MRNLLTRVPKSAEALVATTVRTIFQQPSAEAVHAQHARVVEQLDERFPAAAAMLAEAAAEVLAFTACPVAHWKQVWSNNPQERLNREIRRRTDVVGIFPNRAARARRQLRTTPRGSGLAGLVDVLFRTARDLREYRNETRPCLRVPVNAARVGSGPASSGQVAGEPSVIRGLPP